jgi:ABC-type transport system involved in cytochrome c biogenesis ATPase subunit
VTVSRLSTAQRVEARNFYVTHPDVSVDAMARAYGVGRSVMLRVLAGVTRPAGGRYRTTVTTEVMRRMRDEGLSLAQIGRQVGLSEAAVSRRVRKQEAT